MPTPEAYYYLIFPQNANARSRSESVLNAIRPNKSPNDVTTAWFDVIEHPANKPQSALVVPESELHRLTDKERQALKDYDFMEKGGWFANNSLLADTP
jgi:hypothetical protein